MSSLAIEASKFHIQLPLSRQGAQKSRSDLYNSFGLHLETVPGNDQQLDAATSCNYVLELQHAGIRPLEVHFPP